MKKLFFAIILLLSISVVAQTEVEVTYVEGLAFKNLTTIELNAIATKERGDTYFDTTKGNPVYWTGSSWSDLTGGGLSPGDQTKLNFITVTQNVDLDDIESKANSALQSYTETDPTVTPISIKNQLETLTGSDRLSASSIVNISANETDPIYSGSEASSITATNKANWNSAFGWGDHSIENYLKTIPTATQNAIDANTAKTGITAQQASDIVTNNAKVDTNDFPTGGAVSGSDLTITIPNQSDPVIDLSPFLLETNSVLVKIDEGNGDGFIRTGRNPIFYGNVGLSALDFSTSTSSSSTKGATGFYSFASGQNTTSSGLASFANGSPASATGDYSFANGLNATASGDYSFAHGFDVVASGSGAVSFGGSGANASGNDAFAHGASANASGNLSMARGILISSPSYAETTLGLFGTTYSPVSSTSFSSSDRLFSLANGSSSANRSEALIILKDGTVTFPSLDVGEITDPKSAITKEYADANYLGGGGSGDMLKTTYDTNTNNIVDNAEALGGVAPSGYTTQAELTSAISAKDEADEIPILDTGNNFTAANVEDALAELVAAITSGWTVDQTNRHNNLGLEVFDVLTDNYVTVASDFQKTTGADIGKRTVITHDATTDFTVTVTNAIPEGGSYQFSNRNANGSITLVPDTGIIFNKKSGFNALVNDTTRIAIVKRSTTDFELLGNYDWLAQVATATNLFTTSNAANPTNEANNTTGFSTNDAVINITSSTTQASVGTYSVRVEQTGAGIGGGAQVNSPGAMITGGTEITISIDVYADIGVDGMLVQFYNLTDVGSIATSEPNGTGAWQTISHTFTPSWTGDKEVILILRPSNTLGDNSPCVVYFDNLQTQ